MSVDNCANTRAEAKRAFEQLGCGAVVENSEGSPILRCRLDDREQLIIIWAKTLQNPAHELRSISGSGGANHAVKFKVEFANQSTSGSGTPTAIISPKNESHPRNTYPTCMTLTLEKGNASTFKLICNGLRRLWE